MGITITEIGIECDVEDCYEGMYSFSSTKESLEDDDWGIDTGGSTNLEEWRVYCPKHKGVLESKGRGEK